MRGVSERHAEVFGLSARIASSEMRISEQTCRSVAKRFIRKAFVAVRAFAHREVPAFALITLAADDGEGDYDAIAYRERGPGAGAHFNDFSHGFMTHDVSGLHSGHEMVEQV